jgi:hypothetical protein
MAVKVSDLTTESAPASTDILLIADPTTGLAKKITVSALKTYMDGLGGGSDTTAPTIVSATATTASTVVIVFSESVTVTTAGWSFKKNGATWSISSVTGSGSTWTFNMATSGASSDTLLRSYSSTTGATVDTAANELVTFTDQSVTNSIPAGYDSDAQTFFTAVEATGATISTMFKDAWNTFVVAQKGTDGSWSAFKALYPYYGATSAACAINAKTPGTFNITWVNSPTFSATGVNFNGTTQYGDTGFICNNANGISNTAGLAIGFYGRENIAGYDMGSYESGKETICIPNADGTYQVYGLGGGFNLASGVERTDKFNYVNKAPSGGLTAYRDGVSVATGSYTLDNTGTFSLYVGAANDTTDVYTSNEHAFAFISTGLTTAQVGQLLTDVNTLMTSISRNV